MQPIYDNLEYLMGPNEGKDSKGGKGDKGRHHRDFQGLSDMGLLEVEALTYIRGRSMPNRYLIVDEAQNLTPHEIKTIITRAGEGTKIVLTGDPYQIDNPYIDSSSNGLAYVAERFKNEEIAGHITLIKGERSLLAELAANLL
jgi:PhoH-like ATPase